MSDGDDDDDDDDDDDEERIGDVRKDIWILAPQRASPSQGKHPRIHKRLLPNLHCP